MKTVHKLEFGFGLATLLSTAVVFCVLVEPVTRKNATIPWELVYQYLFSAFIFCFLPACVVAFGAVLHSTKQRRAGFFAVVIGGSFLLITSSINFLGFAVFTGLMRALLLTIPAFLAAVTIVTAFRSRSVNQMLK